MSSPEIVGMNLQGTTSKVVQFANSWHTVSDRKKRLKRADLFDDRYLYVTYTPLVGQLSWLTVDDEEEVFIDVDNRDQIPNDIAEYMEACLVDGVVMKHDESRLSSIVRTSDPDMLYDYLFSHDSAEGLSFPDEQTTFASKETASKIVTMFKKRHLR